MLTKDEKDTKAVPDKDNKGTMPVETAPLLPPEVAKVSPEQRTAIDKLANDALALGELIRVNCADVKCREHALWALEEATMFAIRGVYA